MGVRTCFIISNQAGAPHVSIWKSFTEIHHLFIDESFRNLPIYVSDSVQDETFFTSMMGRIDSGRIVC